MDRFFVSDLHFFHANIIEYCNRPFKTVEEMNEAIISMWNSMVKETDEVFFGGDFGVNPKVSISKPLVSRLNGIKHAIIGNHDHGFKELQKAYPGTDADVVQKYLDAGWASVQVVKHLELKDKKMVCITHLPTTNDEDRRYADYKLVNDPDMLYINGHLHCHWKKRNNMVDIGYDAELRLYTEDEIIDLFNDSRDFIPTRLTEKYKNVSLFLEPFELEVKKGYVSKKTKGDLVLYDYNEKCTFDRHWNDVTIWARGIVFDKDGNLVAAAFPKFWNYGELQGEEVDSENLLDKAKAQLFKNIASGMSYEVFDKLDGSLGIIYNYKGEWHVNTRGSFESEQAVRAKEILKKYDLSRVNPELTLLVEIIYPENRIVCDYKGQEDLILLAATHRIKLVEVERKYLEKTAAMTGMPIVEKRELSFEAMNVVKITAPKDMEGYVVRFSDGLRVKIKCDEYCRIHKIIANCTPLAFWEAMKYGKVRTDVLQELPEEFRKESEGMIKQLEDKYDKLYQEARSEFLMDIGSAMKCYPELRDDEKALKKHIGLNLRTFTHGSVYFSFLDLDKDRIDKQIMKNIRPTNNVI